LKFVEDFDDLRLVFGMYSCHQSGLHCVDLGSMSMKIVLQNLI